MAIIEMTLIGQRHFAIRQQELKPEAQARISVRNPFPRLRFRLRSAAEMALSN
jgi:hypothetical protein